MIPESYILPENELLDINTLLDALNIPRTYPGSNVVCSTRERVNILIQLCKVKGIEWIEQEAER